VEIWSRTCSWWKTKPCFPESLKPVCNLNEFRFGEPPQSHLAKIPSAISGIRGLTVHKHAGYKTHAEAETAAYEWAKKKIIQKTKLGRAKIKNGQALLGQRLSCPSRSGVKNNAPCFLYHPIA